MQTIIKCFRDWKAFLTKPNNTTFMIQDIIKKITKINQFYPLAEVLLMQDLLEK